MESSRLLLPAESVPEWAKGSHVAGLRVVPLCWRTPLSLPDVNRLDAWYLWNPVSRVDEWQMDPQRVIAGTIEDEDARTRLKILVFDASIDTPTRSHRLSCPSLFASLALKSGGSLWVVPALDGSVSIWTDPAFQLHFGRLE